MYEWKYVFFTMSFEKVIESAQIRSDAGDQGHHSQGLHRAP